MKNAAFIHIVAEVRYWEDTEVDGIEDTDGTLIPFREGKSWCPTIDLDTGEILHWPKGTTARVHYKVCDQGKYWLEDEDGNLIFKYKDYYVPDSILCHGDRGYGDYIIFDVDDQGFIVGYNKPELNPDHWEAV